MYNLTIDEKELYLLVKSIEAHQAAYEKELYKENEWEDLWDLRVKLLELYKQ